MSQHAPSPPGALAREILDLAWPVILSGFASTAVLFTDRLMLGRYSVEALGSMAVSGPLVWSIFSVFGAFSAGVMAVVGRSVGAGRRRQARRTAAAALWLAGAVGALVGAAGFALRGAAADTFIGGGAETEAIRGLAVTYLGAVLPASPLALIGAAATAALQASGDTRTPLFAGVAAGGLNLLVSYVLLFGAFGAPELGILGAGLGSACAIGLHAVVVIAVLSRGGLGAGDPGAEPEAAEDAQGAAALLAPVVRVAGPAFGERILFHAGYMSFVALVGRLGEAAMAAHQALISIESLGFLATHGFGVAASALVAQKLGAGRPGEAARCGWWTAGIGASALCGASLLFLLFAEPLVALFIEDPEVVALGARCLRIAAIAQPIMALADAFAGSLRGAGDTRSPMVAALAGPVLIRLAACWFLAYPMGLGLLGIWMGTTLDWSSRALGLGAVWRRGRWAGALSLG